LIDVNVNIRYNERKRNNKNVICLGELLAWSYILACGLPIWKAKHWETGKVGSAPLSPQNDRGIVEHLSMIKYSRYWRPPRYESWGVNIKAAVEIKQKEAEAAGNMGKQNGGCIGVF
jgi:hypothetical protein